MKKILVIDDEFKVRKDIYKNVLSPKFTIDNIQIPNNLFIEIENKIVDCYLVDIVLEKWKTNDGKPQELMPVLDSLKNKKKPIFLVSRQYQTLIHKSRLTPLLDEIIKENISIESFFIWEAFEKEAYRIDKEESEIFTDSISSLIELKEIQNREVHTLRESKKADIGIICALGMELKPILDHLENPKKVKHDYITYTKGELTLNDGKKIKLVVVQQEDMGVEDAAIIGSALCKEFEVKYLFMTGVCGGREGKVKIGDIIIPNEVVAYQRGKYENGKLLFDVGSSKTNMSPAMVFENSCEKILKDIFTKYSKLLIDKGAMLNIKTPVMHFNQMACGANVVDSPNVLDKIATDVAKRKLCSVDMESYSIYRINHFFNVKTLVIKSVMDLTEDKNDDYKEYAAFVSANFLIETIKMELYEL